MIVVLPLPRKHKTFSEPLRFICFGDLITVWCLFLWHEGSESSKLYCFRQFNDNRHVKRVSFPDALAELVALWFIILNEKAFPQRSFHDDVNDCVITKKKDKTNFSSSLPNSFPIIFPLPPSKNLFFFGLNASII